MGRLSDSNRADECFRLAVDAAPNALVMVDQEGRIILVNAQAEQLFGYLREELLGRTIEMLVPRPTGGTSHAQHKNGRQFPVEIVLKPIDTAEGTWVLRSIVDITGRKRAEDHFRLAVESAPNAMVMVNHEGRIVLVNSQTEKLVGYDRQELIGQSIEMLVPDAFRESHPILRVGCSVHAHHKDGRQIPVEIGSSPIEREGRTWVLSAFVDITERTRAEATLRESEERFRNMADTAPVMVWVSGVDKGCTFFNKGWLEFTGRTMEQELGHGWAEGVHPDDLDRCFATYSESFEARRSFQMEYRLRRADGEYRWLLDDGVPRFAPDGIFAGYIGSCVDMTALKRAQEESLASQKLETVGQLARGVAHDFNNLLGGILSTAELALDSRMEGLFPEEELRRIRKTAIHGGEIVRQLMTYSGAQSPVFELVDMSSLVDEMLQLLRFSISRDVVLEADLGKGLPAVQANPAQIRQVVMNLVTNAAEAIGEKRGVIRVVVAAVNVGPDEWGGGTASVAPGVYLKLAVYDTGDGMTPEVQTRIFDPFFTTKATGRGLGLAAVQGIVRSHAGVMNVASSLSKGTRFEILLPFTSQAAQVVSDTASHISDGEASRLTGTILVVEDEDVLRAAVSKMIRRTGLSVIEAADGGEAVELFRVNERDIDVVLLDMTLPGMHGPEVLAELRRIRSDVRIILTTAYSQQMVSSNLDGQNSWAFIRKPYQIRELVQLLRDACRQAEGTSGYAPG